MDWKTIFLPDENGYINIDCNLLQAKSKYQVKPGNYFVCWFETQPRVFYKQNKLGTNMFGELIGAALAKQMGISTVTVHPAVFKNLPRPFKPAIEGVLVEDFVKDKKSTEVLSAQNLFEYGDVMLNSADKHIEALKKFVANNSKNGKKIVADFEQIHTELLMRNIIDFVLLQQDRKPCNIEYLITKGKNGVSHLTLAPMFDNGRCLFFQNKRIMHQLLSQKDEQKSKQFLKQQTNAFEFCFFPTYPNAYYENYNFAQYKHSLARQIEKDTVLTQFLQQLQFVEPTQIILQIEQQNPNFKFDKQHAKVFEKVFNFQVGLLSDLVFELQMENKSSTNQFEKDEFYME